MAMAAWLLNRGRRPRFRSSSAPSRKLTSFSEATDAAAAAAADSTLSGVRYLTRGKWASRGNKVTRFDVALGPNPVRAPFSIVLGKAAGVGEGSSCNTVLLLLLLHHSIANTVSTGTYLTVEHVISMYHTAR